MDNIKVIPTSDGSHSLVNVALNETYHSVHGAIQESRHVYIQEGFEFWRANHTTERIRVLEIGFGTGLNALLTLLASRHQEMKISYESWELFPLEMGVIQQLNYGEILHSSKEFLALHSSHWNTEYQMESNFVLRKRKGDILSEELTGQFNIVYYDAFAPSKQGEMWSIELLKKITGTLDADGVFVTYCARGQVKRDLAALGLQIETLAGPPGKKEMIRAIRN